MATTSISALTETTIINAATVGPFDYAGTTYKVTANTLGAFITTNAVTVSATGNITGGNLLFGAGIISGTGTVSAAGTVLTGNISAAGYEGGANGLSISGNVTGGNLRTSGLISATGAITSGGLVTGSGGVVSQTVAAQGYGMRVIAATTDANATIQFTNTAQNAQWATITANAAASLVLDATTTTASGSFVVPGTITVNSGAAATAIINGAGNAVGNIGSTTTYFNNIFAQATTALYADLAEVYEADADYEPGTVVSFGGTKEVTVSATEGDPTVAGVISANPSYLMNNGLTADHRAIVALTGRVHTSVTGAVTKGAMMISAGNGHARASAAPAMGTVIGKALENFDGESGIIEIVVGRM